MVSQKWKKAAKEPISNEKICFPKPITRKRTIPREKAAKRLRSRLKISCRRTESLYKLVIENMHEILCTLDMEGRFTFVNDVLLAKTGRPREWFMGRNCLEMVQPKDRDAVQEGLKAVLRGEAVPVFELAYNTPSGTMWVEINATPLVYDGQLMGVLVISRDISDRKKIEEELKLYRNNLEELVKTRTKELSDANKRLQREINEHKKTVEALKNSELYYRTIFQNTGTAMVIMEEDTTLSLVNSGIDQIYWISSGSPGRQEESHWSLSQR